jgi:hypothetical protein
MSDDRNHFLLWEATTRDTIDFKKIYVDMTHDIVAGLMLSEIVYWHLPSKRGENKLRVQKQGEWWIAVSRAEWWDRIRLSPRQADTAIKKLIDCNLIEKRLFKFDGQPTVHVRLLWDNFLTLFKQLSENPILQNGESGLTKTDNLDSQKTTIPLTETTAKITEKPLSPATQDAETPPLATLVNSEVIHDSLSVVTVFKPKGLLEIHQPLADMIGIEANSKPTSKQKEAKAKNPLFCEPLKGQVAAVVARYAFDVNYESLNSAEQGKLFKSRISPILKSLLVAYQTRPITADELDAAYRWFRKHNKKANYPAGENTVYTMFLGYRQARAEYENETPTPKLIAKTLPNGTVVYGESE